MIAISNLKLQPGEDEARLKVLAAKALRIKANAGTHSMRKDYAVDLMRKYGDLPRVQRALNHSNPTITALYALADQLVETYPERAHLFRRRR